MKTTTETPITPLGTEDLLALVAVCASGNTPTPARFELIDPPASAGLRAALDDLLVGAGAQIGLTALFDCGLGGVLLPEVAALDMEQPAPGLHKDNLAHSIAVCAQSRWGEGVRVRDTGVDQGVDFPPLLLLRWACLLHDVGKAPTRQIADKSSGTSRSRVTFYNHESVGARQSRQLLARLGYPPDFIKRVAELVYLSGRTHDFTSAWTDAAVRRFLTDAGPLADLVLDLSRADCTSARPGRKEAVRRQVDAVATAARAVLAKDAARAVRPALSGDEIMEILGLDPGPRVGAAYRYLLGFARAGEQLDKAEAVERLLAWSVTQ